MKVHTTLVGEEIIDTRSTFPHDSDEYIAEYLRNTCVVSWELPLYIAEIIFILLFRRITIRWEQPKWVPEMIQQRWWMRDCECMASID